MAMDIPDYDLLHVNDAAIAVGVAPILVATMPYDGYLAAAGLAGAGVEDGELSFSDGQTVQHFPGRDVAIDTDALQYGMNDPNMHTINGLMCVMNVKLQKNVQIYLTYPNGTGTAEANLWLLFTKRTIGDGKYKVWVGTEFTWAAGVIMDLPMNIPGISTLDAIFCRGAAGQDATLRVGVQGRDWHAFARAIAVDTDALPFNFMPVRVGLAPDLRCTAFNGYTGVGMVYCVLS